MPPHPEHLLHLIEERRFLLVPAARINDDDVAALLLELLHTRRCDDHGIRLRIVPIEFELCFGGVLLELIVGPWRGLL